MKRISLRFGIALTTFFTGLLAAAVWLMSPNEIVLDPPPEVQDCLPQYSETFSSEDYGGVLTRPYIIDLKYVSKVKPEASQDKTARPFNLFREMPLSKLPACVDESYRLTFLPTFQAPVVIRVWRAGDRYFIVKKHLSGRGGYDLGELNLEENRSLTKSEWNELVSSVNQAGFWEIPEIVDEPLINDGASWTFEGFEHGRHHFVFRTLPKDKLGSLFINVFNLAGGETDFEKYLSILRQHQQGDN